MQRMSDKGNSTTDDIIKSKMFVTFDLCGEIYAVDVMKVQEIIGVTRITPIPDSIDWIKGVINLRGYVVPVIDMRLKFGLQEKEHDSSTVILIVEINGNSTGLLADSVLDVIDITVDSMHDYSGMDKTKSTFISSIANCNNELILILEADSIINEQDVPQIETGESQKYDL